MIIATFPIKLGIAKNFNDLNQDKGINIVIEARTQTYSGTT